MDVLGFRNADQHHAGAEERPCARNLTSATDRKVFNTMVSFRILLTLMLLAMPALLRAADNELTEAEKAAGWELLFDGKTLGKWKHVNGWKSDELTARPEAIQENSLQPHMGTKPYDYMMVYTEPLEDFVLQMDFKTAPVCNSGIFIRTQSLQPNIEKKQDIGFGAIEIAVDTTTDTSYTSMGALYGLSKPLVNALKPAGEWNHIVITNHENLIMVVLNDQVVNVADLDLWTQGGINADGTEHKFGKDKTYNNHPRKGYIGLQDHGAKCWYKNIKLKRL
jgi:hypothetical protein